MRKKHHPADDFVVAKDESNPYSSPNRADPFAASLYDSLHHLNEMVPDEPPELNQFTRLVRDTKLQERRKMHRDLALFGGVATTILAGWLLGLFMDPAMFMDFMLIISIISIAATPIGVYVRHRHRGETSV